MQARPSQGQKKSPSLVPSYKDDDESGEDLEEEEDDDVGEVSFVCLFCLIPEDVQHIVSTGTNRRRRGR